MKTEYDAVRIIFNRFQSAIAFKPTIATVLSPDALEKEVEAGGKLDQYETEGPDRAEMLQDLAEFQLAVVSTQSSFSACSNPNHCFLRPHAPKPLTFDGECNALGTERTSMGLRALIGQRCSSWLCQVPLPLLTSAVTQ